MTSTANAADYWQQTCAFAFAADVEKKPLNRVVTEAKAIILPNTEFLATTQANTTRPQETRIVPIVDRLEALHIRIPNWLSDRTIGGAYSYVTAVICAFYSKCGGDEAVLVVDGTPPVALLNPFGLAPMRDKIFIDLVSEISITLYSDTEMDTGRKKVAHSLQELVAKAKSGAAVQSTPLLGSAGIVRRDTMDRVGKSALLQGFDLVWVMDYQGSAHESVTLELFYNSAVYAPPSASNWLQSVRAIASTVDLNTKTIDGIDAMDEEMKFRLLHQWQSIRFPAKEYTTTLPQLFHSQVERYVARPETQVAIIEPRTKREVTYAEFDELSTKFALYLHQKVCSGSTHRFGVDAVVGMHLPRCADWYILMLGILKAGGAYLSLDPDFPADRLSYILEDSGAMALITISSMRGQLEYNGGPVLAIDELWDEIRQIKIPEDSAAIPHPAGPNSPAYLIYTSGSTGKPKGVLIEHINAVNFVLSERKLFQLNNQQRVIQGFSTSFDASVEEIWLAFASGSALIAVEKSTMQDADALMDLIAEFGATVLSTVPTLLATMEPSKLKQLQLVIVGGEACNKEVVEMYATGEKRIFCNSYGPTEATVACCADFCTPDRPVTIGRAQPSYAAYIVDERKQLLPPGVPGELCIAGPSVARGYVNRPELTKEKFLHCPFDVEFTRMYTTGDLVRWNPEGKLEFLGRIDSQVKLRGFRIEVGEIENVLSTFKGITTAVVVLRNDAGVPYLAAYLVCEPELEARFNEGDFRAHLKKSLPSYMIPQRFVPITTIPRSPAGKLDRKGFPPPPPQAANDRSEGEAKVGPSTPTEYLLHDIWLKHLTGVQSLSITDNFFEIGGQSLLAGKVSSAIRKAGFDQFSIRYLYSHPTIKELAAAMDTMSMLKRPEPACTKLPERFEPSFLRRAFFLFAQLLVMHATFFFISASLFIFLYGYSLWSVELQQRITVVPTYIVEGMALGLTGMVLAWVYGYLFLPLIKWIVIGKFREGTHSIWSFYFLRWWMVRTLSSLFVFQIFQGTVFINIFLRLMGAKVGRGVIFFAPSASEYDLLDIGDDCWIGQETLLQTAEVQDSMLLLRRVRIGRCSSVGVRSVVKGGSIVGRECILQHMSCVHDNTVIPDGELWGGSPAVRIGLTPSLAEQLPNSDMARSNFKAPAARPASNNYGSIQADPRQPLLSSGAGEPEAIRPSVLHEVLAGTCYLLYGFFLGVLIGSPMMTLGMFLWIQTNALPTYHQWWWIGVAAGCMPFIVAFLLVYVHLWIILLRWIILPWNPKPGYYPVNSWMYHRKMYFDVLMRMSLAVAHPVYASIYTQFILRALGTEVGPRAECSNLFGFTPGLTKLGTETFVADFVAVNPPEIFRGVMHLGRVELQNRAFAGNGAVLPGGTTLGERSLLGLLSYPTKPLEEGSTYIGSPAFSIPRPSAANTDSLAAAATYKPTCWLVFGRCMWEFWRAVTPGACISMSGGASFIICRLAVDDLFNMRQLAMVMSLFLWLGIFFSMFQVVLIKWIIVGREKPAQYPLWSVGVWRAEFVVDVQTVVGGGGFMGACRGTPLLPLMFRLLGAKIGSGCYIDSIFLTEPDMCTIGNNVCLGDRVTMQTHLFEDRVMKIDRLCVEDRVSIGALSVVLYNTNIERGVTIGPLSLVMKGESYPAGTHWEGVPAQRRGVPPIMAVAPPSAPRIAVAPPTAKRQPPSSAGKSSKPNQALGPSISPEEIEGLRSWLLDELM